MSPISSIYIPHVEKKYTAEFIAEVFLKNGIAKVSRVAIETYKNNINTDLDKYKQAYVEIESWCETETAYNFIQRLKTPFLEARLVYEDDFWWSVEINNFPEKLSSNYYNDNILTIFKDTSSHECDTHDEFCDELSVTPLTDLPSKDYKRISILESMLLEINCVKHMKPADDSDGYIDKNPIESSHNNNTVVKPLKKALTRAHIPPLPVDNCGDRNRWNGKEWVYGQIIAAKIVTTEELAELGYSPLELIDGKLKVCEAHLVEEYRLPIGCRGPSVNWKKWAIAPDGYYWKRCTGKLYYTFDWVELIKL